jgi:hypothetical protein
VCRQRRLAVGFPAAFSGLFRMACLDHERNLLDYIRHAGAVSCQDFLQFPKGVTALHREIAGIHDFPSFLMRGNPAVPWFEAITDQNTRSYETPSRHGALVSEIRKLLMPVYVAEIEGFSVLAFHEDDDTGAERTASSEPFRAFISRLKHGGSGQPAWNRSSELHVRRALKDERDAWQAAHEKAIAADNARSDEMDFFAIFLPFVDPAA